MKFKSYRIHFIGLLILLWGCVPAWGGQRLFVLQGESQILEYKIDNAGTATLIRTYGAKDFPAAFPADSLRMTSGNLLRTFDQQKNQTGCFLYIPEADQLKPYAGDPGEPASPLGRVLEHPWLEESFRGEGSLYSKTTASPYRESMVLEQFRTRKGNPYRDLFMLEGQVFGISGDHIDLLSDQSGSALPAGKKALELPGSDLIAAAVSPWREVFLSDSGKKTLQRIVYRNGNLVSNGLLSEPHLTSPRRLEFSPEGELFVANANDGHHGVLRFRFVLEDFVDWTAEPRGSIDLGEVGALGLTLAKPVGFVVSEKTLPLEKVKGHGTHFGVSEGVIAFLQDLPGENFAENSERASASVVEYEPGGHTYVHFHPDMEQMEIVIGGRALWEVGEVEKEVGPGDVIFTPRYVKHGYKVLGDVPFRFYQVEWRGIKD